MSDARFDEVLYWGRPHREGRRGRGRGFRYIKKSNREYGPALAGIEPTRRDGYAPPLSRMDDIGLRCEIINSDSALFRFVL